jgi:hypothetical protein
MITSKEETKQGMEALYHFKQQFPEADTETFLQTTSPFFQNHIRRQLQDIHSRHQPSQGVRPGTANGEKTSAKAYMDRLRQMTTRTNLTAPAGVSDSGGSAPRAAELPDVDRGSKSVGTSSPHKASANSFDSLKARLAKIKSNSSRS